MNMDVQNDAGHAAPAGTRALSLRAPRGVDPFRLPRSPSRKGPSPCRGGCGNRKGGKSGSLNAPFDHEHSASPTPHLDSCSPGPSSASSQAPSSVSTQAPSSASTVERNHASAVVREHASAECELTRSVDGELLRAAKGRVRSSERAGAKVAPMKCLRQRLPAKVAADCPVSSLEIARRGSWPSRAEAKVRKRLQR